MEAAGWAALLTGTSELRVPGLQKVEPALLSLHVHHLQALPSPARGRAEPSGTAPSLQSGSLESWLVCVTLKGKSVAPALPRGDRK